MARDLTDSIPLEGGASMRALLALPDGPPPEGGWPGVVVIHDVFGFSDDVRRITRRFADSGYAAIAPALYDGAGPRPLCVVRTVADMTKGEGPAFGRIEATQGKLADHAEVNGGRIGITGFCMGGGFALFYAARGGVQVCAPYYGNGPEEAEALRKVCPVIAGYGELDKSFADQGRRLERQLESLGVPHEIKIYPGVGHSYMNQLDGPLAGLMKRTPMHAAYDEEAAEDSWRRMLAFFAKHL